MTLPRLTGLAALGGGLGAVLRAVVTEVWPGPGTLAATLVINVVGCALLAALPAWDAVRRSPWLPVFLGTGVLGGFTTMSAAVVAPIDTLSTPAGAGYVALTLTACLGVAALVSALVSPRERAAFEQSEGDE